MSVLVKMILAGLQRKENETVWVQDRTPNPLPNVNNAVADDKRYSALSRGLYEEVKVKKQYEQYGKFVLDTQKKKLVELQGENNFEFLIDPVVFAWSVDPLAERFPQWSPYTAFNNNPIYVIDPTGESGVAYLDKSAGTITIKSTLNFYGNAASSKLAKETAASIQKQWNDANGKVMVGGQEYSVLFEISHKVTTESGALELANNNSRVRNHEQNYVRIESNVSGASRNYNNAKGGSNSIYLVADHLGNGQTTDAHEYGHSLGFLKHEPYGATLDGQPGIFSTIHNAVDAEYTVNPELGNTKLIFSDNGKIQDIFNKLDLTKRKVTQADIDKLNLGSKSFANGKANVGNVDNKIFDKDKNIINE